MSEYFGNCVETRNLFAIEFNIYIYICMNLMLTIKLLLKITISVASKKVMKNNVMAIAGSFMGLVGDMFD